MSSVHGFAQISEYSLHVGGGFSSLGFRLNQDSKRSGGFGGNIIGAGYTYMFQDKYSEEKVHFGIHTGIGFGLYRTKATVVNGTTSSGILRDEDGDVFILRTTISNYNETQTAMFLQIPLMMQANYTNRYYARAGIKAGIPIRGRFSTSGATIFNEADYIHIENKIGGSDLEFMGLGTFERHPKGKIALNFTAMLALETGVKLRVSEKFTLHVGVYFDYGLTNAIKTTKDTFVVYNFNNPQNFTTNSILTQYAGKARVMAVGLTLRTGL